MGNILTKFKATIKEYSLLNKGDHLIVACSGGPDSVALFHLLSEIASNYNLVLYLAHLNHGIRADADEDENFVRCLAASTDVAFVSEKIDCLQLHKRWKISLEGAARRARQEFLIQQAEFLQVSKIALGHNADDQAETLLMRMLRGTGVRGMGGITPKRLVKDKCFIRPLIDCERDEILEYLTQKGIFYRTDSTNLQRCCTRNKIRLDLIPYIKKHINPSIVKVLSRTAKLFMEENQADEWYISNLIKQFKVLPGHKEQVSRKDLTGWKAIMYKRLGWENSLFELLIDDIILLPAGLQRRVLINYLNRFVYKKNYKSLHFRHIEAVLGLIKGMGGIKELILPGGVRVYRNIDRLTFYAVDLSATHIVKSNIADASDKTSHGCFVKVTGESYFEDFNLTLKTMLLDRVDVKGISEDPLIAFLDYDTLTRPIELRTRRYGDIFHPLGLNGKKKLKAFFIDEKVLKSFRDYWPLLVHDSEIYWVMGLRIGHPYRITSKTKRILRIDIKFNDGVFE